ILFSVARTSSSSSVSSNAFATNSPRSANSITCPSRGRSMCPSLSLLRLESVGGRIKRVRQSLKRYSGPPTVSVVPRGIAVPPHRIASIKPLRIFAQMLREQLHPQRPYDLRVPERGVEFGV